MVDDNIAAVGGEMTDIVAWVEALDATGGGARYHARSLLPFTHTHTYTPA